MDPDPSQPQRSADGHIEITVPGDDRFLEVLRAAVGRAAHISGFTFDGIEDLALIVNEAAVLLLDSRPTTIRMSATGVAPGTSALSAEITASGVRSPWPPDGLVSSMRWQVMSTLCESVWLLDGGTGVGLRQSVR
jgi:hypothetical protein